MVVSALSRARLAEVIRYPVVSEKSQRLAETLRTHVFEVAPDADKALVRRAVEAMFPAVKVAEVRILNAKGKRVRTRQTGRIGRRRLRRKAYVTLAEGDIHFAEGA